MAPEQWDADWIPRKVSQLQKVDVFQLGVLFFRLIFKVYPFKAPSCEDPNVMDRQFLENFMKSDRNLIKLSGLSKELISLLKGMLHPENKKRMTLKQVMQSKWFRINSDLLSHDGESQETS